MPDWELGEDAEDLKWLQPLWSEQSWLKRVFLIIESLESWFVLLTLHMPFQTKQPWKKE